MALNFEHQPVLLAEVVALIEETKPKLILDGTLGGAGHASAMLDASPDAKLIGIDRDPAALEAARVRLARFGGRVTLVHAPFSEASQVVRNLGVAQVDATLVDLGVSSHQFDTAERGFSFRFDAPLDMRMDTTRGMTALELIDATDEEDLANLIFELGEERQSRRIARAVKADRPETTGALAELVKRVAPAPRDAIHPATRTFQALRMAVNDELGELQRHLEQLPELLADGGVGMVITFHSLEDRAVKHFFREHTAKRRHVSKYKAIASPNTSETAPFMEVANETAKDAELADNPRARSARLRAVRRIARSA
ncbi:MAG TPA: 16S rRNA (cytosine(1402)-N(4))-methyltransferase RsmH [Myxococcota bacterium]|nr:16S rRNA (cytosine(1402)-N(4))-methyltransferase RsmH [Myxococcota bacterium]